MVFLGKINRVSFSRFCVLLVDDPVEGDCEHVQVAPIQKIEVVVIFDAGRVKNLVGGGWDLPSSNNLRFPLLDQRHKIRLSLSLLHRQRLEFQQPRDDHLRHTGPEWNLRDFSLVEKDLILECLVILLDLELSLLVLLALVEGEVGRGGGEAAREGVVLMVDLELSDAREIFVFIGDKSI